MMALPILAFFSSPVSPPQTPAPASRATTKQSDPWGTNVTLFTHQDGKKFQVTIVRIDETAQIESDILSSYREEDWDSDDWDEDAEDLAEPVSQPFPQPHAQLPLHRVVTKEKGGRQDAGGAEREDHRTVDDWDGDAQDLEEQSAAQWSERPDRPDWVRRQRDADVWRTRLGED